jgi:hypothetical protein
MFYYILIDVIRIWVKSPEFFFCKKEKDGNDLHFGLKSLSIFILEVCAFALYFKHTYLL